MAMGNIDNCPKCGALYMINPARDTCEKCYREEEKLFEVVSTFLRKKDKRSATMATIIEETGTEETLLRKWMMKGRFQLANFPNLNYPCTRCGTFIQQGKLCDSCLKELRNDLLTFQQEQDRKENMHEHEPDKVYYRK
jgi:flagellar operon protein (TIGR03826 family)